MSVCLIALVVFAFLGVFSAKYRRWAREALDCVMRRLTLRPCRASLQEKVRAKLTSKLMKRSPALAGFAHKHFEALSWIFTLLLFTSIALTLNGMYNLAVYGTCDPQHPGQCVFNQETMRVECPHNCIECVCDNQVVCKELTDNRTCKEICMSREEIKSVMRAPNV
mgnify:CR=1 FL=1